MQLTSIINLQYTYRIWLVGRAQLFFLAHVSINK